MQTIEVTVVQQTQVLLERGVVQLPCGLGIIAVRAGNSVSLTTTALWNPMKSLYVGQGITPATLKITVSGTTITDSGGKLMAGTVQVGAVDYANGVLSIVPGGPDYGGSSKTITFVPAAWPIRRRREW